MPSFGAWTDRLKAYSDFVRANGEYQLNEARAKLVDAETAGKVEELRERKEIFKRLEHDFNSLYKLEKNIEDERKFTERMSRKASCFLTGLVNNDYGGVWQGYKYFFSQAIINYAEKMVAITVAPEARSSDNFFWSKDRNVLCESADAKIDNVILLMEWLHTQGYLLTVGKPAWLTVVQLYNLMDAAAREDANELRKAVSELRTGTFQNWSPKALLSIPSNVTRET
jgi:hypothetical protein